MNSKKAKDIPGDLFIWRAKGSDHISVYLVIATNVASTTLSKPNTIWLYTDKNDDRPVVGSSRQLTMTNTTNSDRFMQNAQLIKLAP